MHENEKQTNDTPAKTMRERFREEVSNDPLFPIALSMGVFIVALIIMMAVVIVSRPADWTPPEQPSMYYKMIPVEVVSVNKDETLGGTGGWKRFEVHLDVHSDEYGLDAHLEEEGLGINGKPDCWDVEEGDIIDATLYSWVMESTGKVVRREIAELA